MSPRSQPFQSVDAGAGFVPDRASCEVVAAGGSIHAAGKLICAGFIGV